MDVYILSNFEKLPEIFKLRVTAYEKSPFCRYVNQELFPNGYYDELDGWKGTIHWVIEHNNRIVASARAVILYDINDLGENLSSLKSAVAIPFAYCGRTVVHPDFRHTEAMRLLDKSLIRFLQEDSIIRSAVCYVSPERLRAVLRLGFKSIGSVKYNWGNNNYSDLEVLLWDKE